MSGLSFYILDVFTTKKYAGNQLAVFLNASRLSSVEMLSITREIDFSETTFILSDEPRDGGYDVRIFTPKEEVPFAGHPTLGTAHIIHSFIIKQPSDKVILNLKVGQIPVTFSPDGSAWMKQMPPVFGQVHERELMAGTLGLKASEIDERFPIQQVSTGLPFFIVPLKTIASLKKAQVDKARYYDLIKETPAKAILIFSPETHEPHNHLSVRVFVDYYGMPEDPATGSGNGCLAGYLVHHRYFGNDSIDIRSEQGYEIGRPSLLHLKADRVADQINVFVGGNSMVVARGEWR
jgi:trans-2,3-dihydro-3-hydroxyanthranilate isomerase